jgi:RNA polymerase sigma-70 factor, ECF subfamily
MQLSPRALDRASRVTGLLGAWRGGDPAAREELLGLVYRVLHQRAAAYLRRERGNHTLQPTALVHEAYIRLVGQRHVTWQNRAHFFGVTAQMMRRVLVDHARARRAAHRPGAALRVSLADGIGAKSPIACEVLLVDQALGELTQIDPRQAQIVELKYFAGFSEQEVADLLSLSRSTVTREWLTAKAWLYRRLTRGRARDIS